MLVGDPNVYMLGGSLFLRFQRLSLSLVLVGYFALFDLASPEWAGDTGTAQQRKDNTTGIKIFGSKRGRLEKILGGHHPTYRTAPRPVGLPEAHGRARQCGERRSP